MTYSPELPSMPMAACTSLTLETIASAGHNQVYLPRAALRQGLRRPCA
jgi:hypothetical protein